MTTPEADSEDDRPPGFRDDRDDYSASGGLWLTPSAKRLFRKRRLMPASPAGRAVWCCEESTKGIFCWPVVPVAELFSPAAEFGYAAGLSFQTAGVYTCGGSFGYCQSYRKNCKTLQHACMGISIVCTHCHDQNFRRLTKCLGRWQHLQQLADTVGKSKWVEILCKCQACVCYDTAEEAQTAIATLNGGVLFDVWKNA